MCKAWDDQRRISMEEGRLEGKAEGKAEGKREMEKAMIAGMYEEHIPIEQIARITKTSESYIKELVKRKKPDEADTMEKFDNIP